MQSIIYMALIFNGIRLDIIPSTYTLPENWDEVTLFSPAYQFGTIALVAHNNRAGMYFYSLEEDDLLYLRTSNDVVIYKIVRIEKYQALQPTSMYSDFLDDDGRKYSARQLFEKVFIANSEKIVLQTCIARDGNASWGRMFLIAEPLSNRRIQ